VLALELVVAGPGPVALPDVEADIVLELEVFVKAATVADSMCLQIW
jgi:hypothetical protein